MKAEFYPHGKCSFAVESNIISIDATGPWNIEFFKKMHSELGHIILNDVDDTNFAILLILKGEPVATKDGLDYHLQLVSTGQTKAIAIYSALSEAPAIAQGVFKKTYNQAGLKNKYFDSTASARAWLLKQIV